MREVNSNFSKPVVVSADTDLQTTTELETLTTPPRNTSIHYLGAQEILTTCNTGSEILVLQGECSDHRQHYSQGYYLRNSQAVTLATKDSCTLFIKTNPYMEGDDGNRIIDTNAEHQWLPGPVAGVSIFPLHVFNSESIMLLRWNKACEFKPRLDPQGEELLVVKGLLQNRENLFKPYTWLRNPIEDWRSWHGSTGTLVYYKNGHFPAK